mmetsp:Transcript_5146/g.13022  ORF Transcript_5146/g.13022 Transcript_5146/m.13022 type:complete len:262 (+) Transcript_5146:432-1217(+)
MSQSSAGTSRKRRRVSSTSLANLCHKKTCPRCSTVYGNAKRGRCNGDSGRCDFEFCVSGRAKSAKQCRPGGDVLSEEAGTLQPEGVTGRFLELSEEANKLQRETGWSVFLMGAGPLPQECRDTDPSAALYVQSYAADRQSSGAAPVKVGVLRHGAGASAAELASKTELVHLHSRLAFGSMKDRAAPAPGGQPGRSLEGLLPRLDAAQYLPLFRREEVTLADLLSQRITEADMKDMGIPLGPRRRIAQEAARLGKEMPPGSK